MTNAKHRNLLEEICNCIDPVGNIIVIFLVGGVGRTFGIYLALNSQLKYIYFSNWSVMGQNSPNPWEKATFESHVIRPCNLKSRCVFLADVKQKFFRIFF